MIYLTYLGLVQLSVADVTLGTMTASDSLVSYIDTQSQELLIALDTISATSEVRTLSQFLAEACVAPGSSIRCLEDGDLIRVKIDPGSELGKFLAASG